MTLWKSDLPINDIKRYPRQIILPHVKIEGQKLIDSSKVVIIGMGGLGVPVLTYLASTGISQIGIVDFDRIELHNIQRQVIYKECQVGQYKTSCAKKFAVEANSTIKIVEYNVKCTKENVFDIIKDYDVIADCCDDIESRYIINDACRIQRKNLVSASVLRWEGQVFVIPKDKACYRCMFPEMKRQASNCSTSGVSGPVCGIIGSIQANEVIKMILTGDQDSGDEENPIGNLILFDSLTNCSRPIKKSFKICGVCKTRKMGETFSKPCESENNSECKVLPWNHIIKNMSKYQIVDIRTSDQYKMFRVADSVNIPDVEANLDRLKEFYKPIVLSCYKGCSSKDTVKLLKAHGIDAYSSGGGIEEFKKYVGFYDL